MQSLEDRQLKFRELFDSFDEQTKLRELKRLDRIVKGGRMVLMTPSNEPNGGGYRFNSIQDVVKWLRNNGYPRAANGNIYQVLDPKHSRKSAYGYIFEYDEEA